MWDLTAQSPNFVDGRVAALAADWLAERGVVGAGGETVVFSNGGADESLFRTRLLVAVLGDSHPLE